MLLKLFLYHMRHVDIWGFIRIVEHIHFDIASELVIFGEHCDDRNLKVLCEIYP